MYRSTINDRIQVAHSLFGGIFGPAQKLHGATYEIAVEVSAPGIEPNNVVISTAFADAALASILEPLRFANLDQVREFSRMNTTPEFLAAHIHREMAKAIAAASPAQLGNERIQSMKVTLSESSARSASFEAALESGPEGARA